MLLNIIWFDMANRVVTMAVFTLETDDTSSPSVKIDR